SSIVIFYQLSSFLQHIEYLKTCFVDIPNFTDKYSVMQRTIANFAVRHKPYARHQLDHTNEP
ncbi:MAG: hypothetical protein ABL867_04445, partial [Rickettsiales bacterium]